MVRFVVVTILTIGLAATASLPTLAQSARLTDDMVLALSWQPAFCETAPLKRECESQREGRYDTQNFALHGLWLDASFCTDARYERVEPELWRAMQIVMPGTQSGLHRHQWRKHGTCYAENSDTYFRDAVRLVLAFNTSPIRELFHQNVGQRLTSTEIRAAFDKAFGDGAGDRVLVHCYRDGNRRVIQELRIRLKGDPSQDNLTRLLKQARAQKMGCRGGIVDAVGDQ